MVEWALEVYTEIAKIAVPVAVTFNLADLIVTTILRVGFGGGLWIGRSGGK